jgi:hypothetical protein
MLAVSQGPQFGTEDGFKPGDSAFFVEEARRNRVKVRSDRHFALGGMATRTVLFMDEGGEYDVLESMLEPCGHRWQASPVPKHLESPAKIGAPRYPDPKPEPRRAAESVLDRFTPRTIDTGAPAITKRSQLTEKQRAAFDEGVRLSGSKKLSERTEGRVILLDLQEALVAKGEGMALARALTEMETLAALRGDTMTVEPSRDDARVKHYRVDHDGLAALYTREKEPLTDRQYQAGLSYRKGWELRESSLRAAQTDASGGGAAHDNDAFVWRTLERAEASSIAGRIDIEVGLAAIRTGQTDMVKHLRGVVGAGSPLASFGDGFTFTRNLRALKEALDIAGTVIEKVRQEAEARLDDNRRETRGR